MAKSLQWYQPYLSREKQMTENCQITCSFCHARQHLLCYGFESSDDPRLPDTHACYQCLLEPDERQLLREMHTLVLLRRALKIILDEGFPNKTSTFTQKLRKGISIVSGSILTQYRLQWADSRPDYRSFAKAEVPSVDSWVQKQRVRSERVA